MNNAYLWDLPLSSFVNHWLTSPQLTYFHLFPLENRQIENHGLKLKLGGGGGWLEILLVATRDDGSLGLFANSSQVVIVIVT